MAVRAETMALMHEPIRPILIEKNLVRDEVHKISRGDYIDPVSTKVVEKHSQDISPRALLDQDIRCVLHVAYNGEGLVQVMFPDKKDDHDVIIPRNALTPIQDDMPEDFGEEGKEYVLLYGVVDLVK